MSTPVNAKAQLEALKKEADELKIQYSPNIGLDTLQQRIDEAKAEDSEVDATEEAAKRDEAKLKKKEAEKAMSPEEKEKARKAETIAKRDEANKLIRVIVTPNEPEKRSLNGEIFSVSNDVINQKKFVSFNNENGWHIPMGLYYMLKDKKFQTFRDVEINGKEVKRGSLIPAYNITVLDPLTPKELKQLAESQAARNSIKDK